MYMHGSYVAMMGCDTFVPAWTVAAADESGNAEANMHIKWKEVKFTIPTMCYKSGKSPRMPPCSSS